MQLIIILGITMIFLFIGSIIFFLIAIIKKKMPLFYLALLLSFVGVGTGFFICYKFLYKSYSKISKSLEPRTGEEIYATLFDGNPNECTNVIEKQDQVVPKIDVAIYLHFTRGMNFNQIANQLGYHRASIKIVLFATKRQI